VTDLRMPGRGGLWLVQQIRSRWPEIGIIVLTAGHDAEATNECLRAGAHHYFFKPIKLDEFRHVLETAWRTYHADKEARAYRTDLERAVRHQTRRVRKTFLSAITSLARTVEERDLYTAGHSRRVRNYSLHLARALGLDRRQKRLLSLAAQLHDVGKVGIPDAILLKAGPLSGDELEVVKTHPEIGRSILAGSGSDILKAAEEIAAFHHEWWNGTGYPYGLAGDDIPLAARIVALADVFDALSHSRPYKAAWPRADALAEIRRLRAVQFDPAVVDAFEHIEALAGAAPGRNGIVVPLFAAAADAAAGIRPGATTA